MRYIILIFFVCSSIGAYAQELFVVTEPASNVPAGSLSVRVGQSLMKSDLDNDYMYALSPEVTWGINKNLMVRASSYFDNSGSRLDLAGASAYAKYRFYSVDDLQSHFRMAAFGRYSWNKTPIRQEAIDLMGKNSGFEVGLVATQLIKKVALSTNVSYARALDNDGNNFPELQGQDAVNYTFSVGRLMYPNRYTSYKQTNINAMLELVGQTITKNGRSYMDVVPAVQFIINSQARIDLAYQKQLYGSVHRPVKDGVFLKLEYTFFNVTK
ncbi:hypothetical protein SAMN05660841_01936 [Sphingobacterium nematocida]|uniref:MetA-pathway of phenol degradation n=1 Tax=Sphingobacterium nematocida TaxID=1513896 RepID=A0A1T5DFU5_9SPHI|nr:hypothetical protein [Sphingobacterium nematocida]SKB70584.1 hypothetical protein SAMN05660841_01936 [Sphingobacterium nematocida]